MESHAWNDRLAVWGAKVQGACGHELGLKMCYASLLLSRDPYDHFISEPLFPQIWGQKEEGSADEKGEMGQQA